MAQFARNSTGWHYLTTRWQRLESKKFTHTHSLTQPSTRHTHNQTKGKQRGSFRTFFRLLSVGFSWTWKNTHTSRDEPSHTTITLTHTQQLSNKIEQEVMKGNNSSGQLKFFHNISIEKQDKLQQQQQPKPIHTNTRTHSNAKWRDATSKLLLEVGSDQC